MPTSHPYAAFAWKRTKSSITSQTRARHFTGSNNKSGLKTRVNLHGRHNKSAISPTSRESMKPLYGPYTSLTTNDKTKSNHKLNQTQTTSIPQNPQLATSLSWTLNQYLTHQPTCTCPPMNPNPKLKSTSTSPNNSADESEPENDADSPQQQHKPNG